MNVNEVVVIYKNGNIYKKFPNYRKAVRELKKLGVNYHYEPVNVFVIDEEV